MNYPITYSLPFMIFWGIALGAALGAGGILSFATAAAILLMLIHHEHAHLRKMEQLGVTVKSVSFGAFGGMIVPVRDGYPQDSIEIHAAGVINSGAYAAAMVGILATVFLAGWWNGWNFADATPFGLLYWIQFLNSLTLAAVVLVASNVIPIVYHSKEHGPITTDGWAVVLKRELRDELWNDGKILAGG